MKVKRFLVLYGLSLIVGLYTTYVMTVLWDWFVVPAFHVGEISFWVMYGLTLLISMLRDDGKDFEAEHRYKAVAVALDACLPEHKRQEVSEELESLNNEVWWNAGWKVFGQVVANSLTLAIGFFIHGLT